MWQSVKVSNVFNTLTLKQIFWKTKTFFKKLEYRFLVESTKIENASFPYKTAISEANVKTNRMVTTKWAYHRERSFTSNYFIFLKVLFQFKNLLWIIDLMYQQPKFRDSCDFCDRRCFRLCIIIKYKIVNVIIWQLVKEVKEDMHVLCSWTYQRLLTQYIMT